MPARKRAASKKTAPVDPGPIPQEKICTLDGFLRQFVEQHNCRTDQPFCFILGAGASRDSGIKTGGEMAGDWLRKLHQDRDFCGLSFDQWIKDGNPGINGFDPKNPAFHYSELYELLYKDKIQAGFSYLETVMEGKDPSFGYSVLSYLLSETHHRIVITTNFDNLVTDALAIHSGTFPIVVNDDSLVHYVRANVHRPLVAKIHGSLAFKPKSIQDDLKLDEGWRKALAAIFKTHTPVVIGYDGNDGSLMRLLMDTAVEEPPEFIWWCYHCKDGENPLDRANKQPPHVRGLVLKRAAQMVPIPGFDLLMLKLLTLLEKQLPSAPDLVQRLEERTHTRLEDYKRQRNELAAKLVTPANKLSADKPLFSGSSKDPDLTDALALLAKGTEKKQWWQWQSEINDVVNPLEKDALYQAAINALPLSPKLLGNYAAFLTEIRNAPDAAEACYKRALEADPNDANNLGNYAIFLKVIREDFDAAETFYKRAIEADPKHANNLGNYGIFLKTIRKDFDAAETFYKRAIEADPKNADYLGNYGNFLTDIRQEHDSAEMFYKRALEARPEHAASLTNYAVFLVGIRKDPDAAEVFFKRSLMVDPGANNLGNYANFLANINKDYDAAEAFYKRAIEVDSKHATNLGNYSQFLVGQGRFEEGLIRLGAAWEYDNGIIPEDTAEFAFSLWLGSLLAGKEGVAWERAFKHSIKQGFRRPTWNFDTMLFQAEKILKPADFKYAKVLAEAFLDESKVPMLEKFSRWKKLTPLDPKLVNPDGSISTETPE